MNFKTWFLYPQQTKACTIYEAMGVKRNQQTENIVEK